MEAGSTTVLVIDDSASDRAIVCRYLVQSFGPQVRCVEAETGAAALAELAQLQPDCVLLDIGLPDVSGLDLLTTFAQHYGPLAFAVVVLTGSGSEETAVLAMKRGAHDYLVKHGLTAEQVWRAVAGAIEKVTLQREIAQQRRDLELHYAAAETARAQVTTILESISDAFMALDPEWRLTYVNAEAVRLFGRGREALVGRSLLELLPPAGAEQLHALLAQERRVPASIDLSFAERWYEVRMYPAADGSSIYVQDVTARRRAEQALRESEAFQRSLVDSSPDCIKVLDLAGHLVWMSPNGQTMMEVDDFGAIAGVDWTGFWAGETQPTVKDAIAQARAGHIGRFEGFCPTLKGTPKYWEVVVVPLRGPTNAVERLLASSRDITERKAAEQALARQAALLDQSHDAILIWDYETGISYWNKGAAELYGWSAAEALGQASHALLQTVAPLPIAELRALLQRDGRWEGELRHTTRDGRALVCESRCVVARYDDGAVLVMETNRDITERKRAEAELRRAEHEVRSLVQNAPDVIARFDRELRHIYVNAAVEQATGLPASVFLGKTNRDLGMPADLLAQWDEQLLTVFRTGAVSTLEFTTPTPTGPRYYQSQLVPELDERGVVQTILSVARDVTTARRAELGLRFLADASAALGSSLESERALQQVSRLAVPVLADWCAFTLLGTDGSFNRVGVVSVDGLQIDASSTYVPDAAFGPSFSIRERRSQLYNLDPDGIARDPARDELVAVWQRGLRATLTVPLLVGERVLGAIMLAMTSSGRRFDASALALAEEVAGRAALALEHARLYREAQEAIRERDAFLAIASHELKNPLTTMLGRADLMRSRAGRSGVFGEREHADVEIIIHQGRRINQLLSDLLDATRLDRDQFVLESVRVDLSAMVQHVAAALSPTLVRHELQIATPGPLIVRGDPPRLEQVLNNLLTNAIKYSPRGGLVQIELSTEGGQVCLSVSDQGIGIALDALPHLFKRFYRAPGLAEKVDGTGIGLYVVKELVERHGGTIGVTSTPDVGSTFTVRLPLAIAASGAANVEAPVPA